MIQGWIPKGLTFACYGTIHKIPIDRVLTDLIKAAEKARYTESDSVLRMRDRSRILKENDWEALMLDAKKSEDTLDILTADYSNNPEKELLLSTVSSTALNRSNYIAIAIFSFTAIFCVSVAIGITDSQFPKFVDHVLEFPGQ